MPGRNAPVHPVQGEGVDGEGALDLLIGSVEQPLAGHDSGVVDEHIDRAGLHRCGGDCLPVGDVDGEGGRRTASGPDRSAGCRTRGGRKIPDHHPGAAGGGTLGEQPADAAAAAGDENSASAQRVLHRRRLPSLIGICTQRTGARCRKSRTTAGAIRRAGGQGGLCDPGSLPIPRWAYDAPYHPRCGTKQLMMS